MVYQNTDKGLRPYKKDLPDAVIAAIERAEDDAIAAALTTGRYAEEYLYWFTVDGKEVLGISTPGAFEIARRLGNIEVLPDARAEKDDAEYHVVVRVRDALRNVIILGAARQPLKRQVKIRDRQGRETGEYIEKPDAHAWTIALSKAQRNGILHLIPNKAKIKIVESFLAAGKGRRLPLEEANIGPGTQPRPHPKPKPASTPRITAEEFVSGGKEKGYSTSEEVCAALGVSNTVEMQKRMTLAQALEKLPVKAITEEISELDF